jgi:hypothetical protein
MEDRRPTVSGSISSRSAEDDAHHHQLPAVQVHHYVAGVSRYIQPADSLPELLVQCPRGCEQAWSHWAWALVGSGLFPSNILVNL